MEEQEKKEQMEIDNKRRKKSSIMLCLYGVLFLVLIILSRAGDTKSIKNEINKDNSAAVEEKIQGLNTLSKMNFNYEYVLMIDDSLYSYHGKKFGDKDMYTLDTGDNINEYYTDRDITLIKKGQEYVLVDKPYYLFDYFDVNNVVNILNASRFNQESNLYEISNSSLAKSLNKEIKSDKINTITIYHHNSKINKIVMDITNYGHYFGEKASKIIITLEYSDYNKVDNFNLY